MTKHTPGPWQAAFVAESEWDYGITTSDDAEEFERVALTTTEANARLIAAAPDLLEAAKGVTALTALGLPAGCEEFAAAFINAQKALRTAIAKAEGRGA